MAIALREIPGMGPKTAHYLAAQGVTSAEALLEAGLMVLAAAPGFGDARARQVMDAAAALVIDAEESNEYQEGGQPAGAKGDKETKKKKQGKKKGKKKGNDAKRKTKAKKASVEKVKQKGKKKKKKKKGKKKKGKK